MDIKLVIKNKVSFKGTSRSESRDEKIGKCMNNFDFVFENFEK